MNREDKIERVAGCIKGGDLNTAGKIINDEKITMKEIATYIDNNANDLNFIFEKEIKEVFEVALMMHANYRPNFPAGDHYTFASEELSSDIILQGANENGQIIAQGKTSKKIAQKIARKGVPLVDGRYTVSYDKYVAIRGKYMAEKDQFIKERNLYFDKPKQNIPSALEDHNHEDIVIPKQKG